MRPCGSENGKWGSGGGGGGDGGRGGWSPDQRRGQGGGEEGPGGQGAPGGQGRWPGMPVPAQPGPGQPAPAVEATGAMQAMRARLFQGLRLYVVTDRNLARGREEEEVVSLAIAGGATAIQFRAKDWDAGRMVEVGLRLRRITRDMGVLYIVNDRVDVAMAVDADGVHLGQEDFPVPLARKLLGPGRIIGLTVHNAEQAAEAEGLGADYLGTAAVFPTDTKKYAAVAPLGLAGLEEIVRATRLPVVAIGGVSKSNAAEVMATGVAGIAVVSAVVAADDIRGAARDLRTIVDEALGRLERRSS